MARRPENFLLACAGGTQIAVGSKKKQRRAAQREARARQEQSPRSPETPPASEDESPQKGPLASADRFFTLVGFGILIMLVIVIAPYFAHKQDRDFEATAKQAVAELQSQKEPDLLSEAARKQLKDLNAYPVKDAEQVFIQANAKQASIRVRFDNTPAQGLLTLGFLLKQELSLSSRWNAVSFCRPDQKGAQVARDYLNALQNKDFQTAYNLSMAAVSDLETGITLKAFQSYAEGFLAQNKTALSQLSTPLPPPKVDSQNQQLTARWSAGAIELELLENPLQCAYAVKFALQ